MLPLMVVKMNFNLGEWSLEAENVFRTGLYFCLAGKSCKIYIVRSDAGRHQSGMFHSWRETANTTKRKKKWWAINSGNKFFMNLNPRLMRFHSLTNMMPRSNSLRWKTTKKAIIQIAMKWSIRECEKKSFFEHMMSKRDAVSWRWNFNDRPLDSTRLENLEIFSPTAATMIHEVLCSNNWTSVMNQPSIQRLPTSFFENLQLLSQIANSFPCEKSHILSCGISMTQNFSAAQPATISDQHFLFSHFLMFFGWEI